MPACTQCGAELETPLACGACGNVFSVEKASPFNTFGLEPAYAMDAAELKRRLLRFSRLCHPDFFGAQGPEVRELAENASATLNAGHAILTDDFKRADWLVRHLGGPDEETERQIPQEFLMEVLEWNETLEEARDSEPSAELAKQLDGLEAELEEQRTEVLAAVAAALTPLPETGAAALGDVRKRLNAIRYVDRALSQIQALRLEKAATR